MRTVETGVVGVGTNAGPSAVSTITLELAQGEVHACYGSQDRPAALKATFVMKLHGAGGCWGGNDVERC